MDALLGAAALGDIGVLFPVTDERYEGADSGKLASEVAALLRERGFEIVNLDLTLLAEDPRIDRCRGEMQESIAACLQIDPGSVSVKASTLERLGALGRGEGIACQAVALVSRRSGGS